MSPLEIPGTVLKFLNKAGKKKCPKCGQYFDAVKVKVKKGFIFKLCPHCNYEFIRYDQKKVVKMAAKRQVAKRPAAKRRK